MAVEYGWSYDIRKVFDSKEKAIKFIDDTFGYNRDGYRDIWYEDDDYESDYIIIEEWDVE